MTEKTPTVVKSIRVDPGLWLRVVNRAASVGAKPNAWVVRALKDTLKRVEGETR